MRILYVDCFSGISGDMMVGALADLGVTPSTFEWELSKMELGDFHLHFERQTRRGIAGIKFDVHSGSTHLENAPGSHDQETDHPDHSHEHEKDCHACSDHTDDHHPEQREKSESGHHYEQPKDEHSQPKGLSDIRNLIQKS